MNPWLTSILLFGLTLKTEPVMWVNRMKPVLAAILFLAVSFLLNSQAKANHEIEKSCQGFVEQFYKWYVPVVASENQRPSWLLALRNTHFTFSHELSQLLEEDSGSPDRVNGQIVEIELGSDPFLSTQDIGDPPGDPYVVGEVRHKGESCWADVYRMRSGKKTEKPVVVAELIFKDNRWVFVNFHFPGEGDLLSILKHNREERLRFEREERQNHGGRP